jgi:hypothetical protein
MRYISAVQRPIPFTAINASTTSSSSIRDSERSGSPDTARTARSRM